MSRNKRLSCVAEIVASRSNSFSKKGGSKTKDEFLPLVIRTPPRADHMTLLGSQGAAYVAPLRSAPPIVASAAL